MQTITDDFMLRMLPRARNYCIVILRAGPKSKEPGIEKIISSVEETKRIMDEDPGVIAEVFVYELHACRSFPGDCLPK